LENRERKKPPANSVLTMHYFLRCVGLWKASKRLLKCCIYKHRRDGQNTTLLKDNDLRLNVQVLLKRLQISDIAIFARNTQFANFCNDEMTMIVSASVMCCSSVL